MTLLEGFKHVGNFLAPLPVKKTELPDGTCILYGRAQRQKAGDLRVDFGHKFSDPSSVVVLATGNFDRQVGFIETVTRIESDHFIVTSNNAHGSNLFVSWIAVGHQVSWTAFGR
ncbi:MAG TPA: hypothetical protein VHD14_07165 [Pseudolabrys sp.]|jgi:hypothetical protein|nr:hypothetical protein [Pseudolabrys sp.]